MYMHIIPSIKLQNLRKRKIHITHHCMPNSIYVCILPCTCWKSPEKACDMQFGKNVEHLSMAVSAVICFAQNNHSKLK